MDHMDRPAGHGMCLFGEATAYLSHLPMFMSPHNYQAIFEVTLLKAGIDPLAVYVEDRKENPQRPEPTSKMYGWQPAEAFVLTELVTPNPNDTQHRPLLSSFKGDIFRGHFEDFHVHEKAGPPVPGLDNVVAHVENVVLFRELDTYAQAPPLLSQLEYFLIGKAEELFLVHVITQAPDFDQILGVQVEDHQFTDAELRQGVLVTFSERANSADQKINEQEQVSGRVLVPGQDGSQSLEVQLRAGSEFYFETDDLSPMQM